VYRTASTSRSLIKIYLSAVRRARWRYFPEGSFPAVKYRFTEPATDRTDDASRRISLFLSRRCIPLVLLVLLLQDDNRNYETWTRTIKRALSVRVLLQSGSLEERELNRTTEYLPP